MSVKIPVTNELRKQISARP